MKEELIEQKLGEGQRIYSAGIKALKNNDGMEGVVLCGFIRDMIVLYGAVQTEIEDYRKQKIKEYTRERDLFKEQKEHELSIAMTNIENTYTEGVSRCEFFRNQYKEKREKQLQETLKQIDTEFKKFKTDNDKKKDRAESNWQSEYYFIKEKAFNWNKKAQYKKIEEERDKIISDLNLERQEEEKVCLQRKSDAKKLADQDILERSCNLENQKKEILEQKERNLTQKKIETDELLKNKNEEYRRKTAKEEKVYKKQMEQLENWFSAICNGFLNEDFVKNRLKEKGAWAFDFEHYFSHDRIKKIPSEIDLGTWWYSCEKNKINVKGYEQLLKYFMKFSEAVIKHNGYNMCFPFKRQTKSGLFFYLSMNTSEHRKYLRSLILANLMQYPAGKLNLVMIDPRTSSCFGGFARLGEDDASMIDTSVWVNEYDICNAISRLRARMSQLINEYGNEVELCNQKEKHHLLVIADFPEGFNQRALDDLTIILEKGSSYGINVIISQNDERMNHLQTSEKNYIDQIIKKMQVISYYDQTYITKVKADNGDLYQLEHKINQGFFEQNAIQIINRVKEEMADQEQDAVEMEAVYQKSIKERALQGNTLDGIRLPIGTKGVGGIGKLIFGRPDMQDIRQHILFEGAPGSGKTTLLHAIISSALMAYSPDELQLFLLDFKDGVEFKIYADYDLPSVQVVSTRSEREFGRSVFQLLEEEHEYRAQVLKDTQGELNEMVENTVDYRKKTGKSMPMILLVVDEFETLLGNDELSKDIMKSLEKLVEQGRATGIHIILAGQYMNLPEKISSLMAVRFALPGSSNILKSDNNGVELLKEYQVVFNDNRGDKNRNQIISVMYVSKKLPNILRQVSELEAGKEYENLMFPQQKLLYTNISDAWNHPFNQLIREHKWTANALFQPGKYVAEAGESYNLDNETAEMQFDEKHRANLLVVTKNTELSLRIMLHVLLGILYSYKGMENEKCKKCITIMDFNSIQKRLHEKENLVALLADDLSDFVEYYSKERELKKAEPFEPLRKSIENLYEDYVLRKKTGEYAVRKFLVILELEGTSIWDKRDKIFDDTDVDIQRLKDLMSDGANYGIHLLISTSDYELTKFLYGKTYGRNFQYRIAAQIQKEDMVNLVKEAHGEELNQNTGVFYDDYCMERQRFRIMELPKKDWIEKFGEALKD